MSPLPVPGDIALSFVMAADPTGSVVYGRSYPPDTGYHRQVIRWVDGRAKNVDFPGLDQNVTAVNAGGLASAFSYVDDFNEQAYVVDDGAVAELPGGAGAEAWGINDAGVIVGVRNDRAIRWADRNTAPVELAVPDGTTYATARGIDTDGTIVGSVHIGPKNVAWVWAPDGTGRALPYPGGEQGSFGTSAYSVRNGWVIGVDNDVDGDINGVRWNLRTGAVEAVPDLSFGATAVNAAGWMAGPDTQGRAELLADGHAVLLPDVYPHIPGDLTNIPDTVSDDGRIINGHAFDDAGVHAVVWHCG